MTETAMAQTEESRDYRLRWFTLSVLLFCVLVLSLNTNMLNVALPKIQADLGASSTQLQWIVNIYMMVAGALVLTSGALSDRLGRARFLQAGLVLFCLSNFGAVLSTSPIHLIIARGALGVSAALIQPCTLSVITNIFPKEERAKAIGLWAGLSASGLAIGPIIGGAIVEHLDWQWVFVFNIIVAAIPLVLGWFLVPNSKDAHPHRLDLPGNTLFLAGIASLIYGLNNAGSNSWSDFTVLGPIIASVVVIIIFVLWELRTPEPLLDMHFFKSPGFSASLTSMMIFIFGLAGLQFLLIFYLQLVKGYTALQTGERCIPLAIGMLIGAIASERIVARIGTKRITSLGFLFVAIVLLFIIFLKIDSPYLQLGTELFFLGLFSGFVTAPASTMLMGSLPTAKAGIGSAMSWVVNYVGASVGVAALGSLLSTIYSNHFENAAKSIQGLPTALADKASDSIGTTMGIAKSGQVPQNLAGPMVEAGRHSFMDGWHIVAIVVCAIVATGTVICLLFMPSRLPDESKDTTNGETESENE